MRYFGNKEELDEMAAEAKRLGLRVDFGVEHCVWNDRKSVDGYGLYLDTRLVGAEGNITMVCLTHSDDAGTAGVTMEEFKKAMNIEYRKVANAWLNEVAERLKREYPDPKMRARIVASLA